MPRVSCRSGEGPGGGYSCIAGALGPFAARGILGRRRWTAR